MAGIRFTYKIIPLRMSRGQDTSVDIIVSLENNTEEEKLVSVEALIKTHGLIGFDQALTHKRAVKKVGILKPSQRVEFPIRVYGSTQTKPLDYDVELTLFEHFQDLTKVVNQFSRTCAIRVI
ncbi:MAG: hypothetical protein D6769_01315 [Methanobacteriota archaeon]|nr:MAG: hypothetical protein D6769_01315 [Euryarchaeota archaeon]